jgi:hypothetical protein
MDTQFIDMVQLKVMLYVRRAFIGGVLLGFGFGFVTGVAVAVLV